MVFSIISSGRFEVSVTGYCWNGAWFLAFCAVKHAIVFDNINVLAPANIEKLRLVMTVSSPMAGVPAAASGVKYSPIVVPSWCDVEPESEFLQKINAWNWPKEIPYHLIISYVRGENGDGVVPLSSQAQLKLQSEATRLYVLNNDHIGIMKDKAFHGLFNTILSNAPVRSDPLETNPD